MMDEEMALLAIEGQYVDDVAPIWWTTRVMPRVLPRRTKIPMTHLDDSDRLLMFMLATP